MARNAPTQGTGADIAKSAAIDMFDWIVTHNLFGKVKLVCMVHDEICFEYPEYLQQFPKLLESTMERAAEKYCKSVPIPAEASVDNFWVH